ncbi:NADPH-dependent 7-cyano-7-deazaguanine reductase QueF [Candidimonas sp. SYP-B2681]|uniref:NADPH-dependent 7-cyano-7-deazaguanine reductase QueF n=1 Tax=Candidimonas sp. SYP-B2681 TaxID=2497686 RepID=UPI000F89B64E|nr:NADPH-dependent 7-cyano-7-deazaguanine reductase QueF [Candidimonas sp. SYP-B2681]RTZ41023.1 NADPH-dependent 7-cyano-7-deazaguanine reductase QueF [Candidimonas sp. SYP-B2681]
MHDPILDDAPLGHEVAYPAAYDPTLLFPIDRSLNRKKLNVPHRWYGEDIWNAYEISWLNPKGKPVVAIARFIFAPDSPRLVESKSLKLYLNSLNEERFDSAEVVRARISSDLAAACGAAVATDIDTGIGSGTLLCQPMEGVCIDGADIEITNYQPSAGILQTLSSAETVTETLMSDLLKSNCPVTGQPDWGSVQVSYTGPPIDRASLLEYIVSMRRHNEFHEHCVEQMYCDIWYACQPESLLVYARYTRRGGLDINPWRSSQPASVSHARTIRQ